MTVDILTDCHMHSTYSDGSHTIDQVARSALEKGLKTIAITDHMPLPFATRYAMKQDRLEAYRREIRSAQQAYEGRLTILCGLEMEYLPRHRTWIDKIAGLEWDLLLISVHGLMTDQGHFMVNGREDEFEQTLERIFGNDIKAFCTVYFRLIQEAVATGWFDVAAHLDVIKKHNQGQRYFDETAPWYRALVLETLDLIAEKSMKLEINTNGINHPAGVPYPSPWIIDEAKVRKIPLIFGSDAHSPRFQGQFFAQLA